MKAASLQSYAFQLRKLLIHGCSLDELLTFDRQHQAFVKKIASSLSRKRLSASDRFAWKFIREVNILKSCFLESSGEDELFYRKWPDQKGVEGQGVYQNLDQIVAQVQRIWFGDMKTLPRVKWLKHFSVRKLAHYAYQRDEIAFSLIFDSPDAPAEILSYLAYHELLHRQVGAEKKNGRHYHHTTHFKKQEKLFPNWKSIEERIARYIIDTR